MKHLKIFLIPSIIVFLTTVVVTQNNFLNSLYQAKVKAKKENKRIFADFTAEWCKSCKMVEDYCFTYPEVKKILEEKYICVRIDEKGYRGINFQYNVHLYPTFIIMEKDGKEVYRWSGYSDVPGFIFTLNSVPPTNNVKEKYDSIYLSNKNNIEFLYDYHNVLFQNTFFNEAESVADKILEISNNWFEKKNMELIITHLNKKKYKDFLEENKQEFIQTIGEEKIYADYLKFYFKNNYKRDVNNKKPDIELINPKNS